MKCDENENNKPCGHMNVDNLDRALHDLGMLSAITEARHDYLREANSNLLRQHRRYVSNVTVGYCMKRALNKNRLCPYMLPVRHRTKSENSDSVIYDVGECNRDYKVDMFEPSTSGLQMSSSSSSGSGCSTKRCQSLENLLLPVDAQPTLETSQVMDTMSNCIQKLQVGE